jgi:hypothetical protein
MRIFLEFIAMVALAVEMNQAGADRAADDLSAWTNDFSAEKEALVSTGRNAFFILEPGYQLVLEKEKDRLVITVLNETKQVDGVETRIVEERETVDSQVVEVSRNYFAISKRTGNVYYFGEDVDTYKDGKVASHDGSWLSGVNGARFGLMMAAVPLVGAKYYQEVAPQVAMDRAEVVGVNETFKTPAGEFKNCVKTKETTPLEADVGHKHYAPGIGLVQDAGLVLVRHGMVTAKKR